MSQPAMKQSPSSAAPPPDRMSLTRVVKGRIEQPTRLIMYGPPGIGKSTFAAGAPAPIFLGAEKGTAELDIARFPQPETWAEILDAVTVLGKEAHAYKTIVLDTLDWIEPLIHAHILSEANKSKGDAKVTDIDSIGYGRGYNLALTQWRKLISYLERLSEVRSMHIIMLAHSQIKSFKNPEGEDFDRYEMKIHYKAAGLCQEWADEVLFANWETYAHEKKGRVRGISSGARIIHTTRTAAYDAKNRHSLPDELPLSWGDYAAAVLSGKPAEPGEIKAAIEELLQGAADELRDRVNKSVVQADDSATKLAIILNKLKAVRKDQTP